MSRLFVVLFSGLAICGLTGCEYTTGYVHIDNAGPETISVSIDGQSIAEIPSGECEKVEVDLGKRHFVVTQGANKIYDETLTLDFADRPYHCPEFVLNPDATQYYCEVEVVYGEDRHEHRQVNQAESLIRQVSSQPVDENADEDSGIRWQSISQQFRGLKNDLIAYEKSTFFRIEIPGPVLQPVPSQVFVRRDKGTTRDTLIRVPAEFHQVLFELQATQQPTVEDLDRMLAATEIARALVPYRE